MKEDMSEVTYQDWRLLYEVEAEEQEQAAKERMKAFRK